MGNPKSWGISVKNNVTLAYVVFHYFLSGPEFTGIWCLQVCGEHEVGYGEVQGEVLRDCSWALCGGWFYCCKREQK